MIKKLFNLIKAAVYLTLFFLFMLEDIMKMIHTLRLKFAAKKKSDEEKARAKELTSSPGATAATAASPSSPATPDVAATVQQASSTKQQGKDRKDNIIEKNEPQKDLVASDDQLSGAPTIPLNLALAGINVEDLSGNILPLTSLWNNKRCIVAVLRRFGCLVCRLQCMDLSSLKPKLDKMGISLIAIGFEKAGLDEFLSAGYFAGEVYIDKSRSVYRALSLKRMGFWDTTIGLMDPRLSVYRKEAKDRGLPSSFQGDGLQLGATLVVGPKPQGAHYDFRQKNFLDVFDLNKILKACKQPYPEAQAIEQINHIENQMSKLMVSLPGPVRIDAPAIHFARDNNDDSNLQTFNPFYVNNSSRPSSPSRQLQSPSPQNQNNISNSVNNSSRPSSPVKSSDTMVGNSSSETTTTPPTTPPLVSASSSKPQSSASLSPSNSSSSLASSSPTTSALSLSPPSPSPITSVPNKSNSYAPNTTTFEFQYDATSLEMVNFSTFITKLQGNIDTNPNSHETAVVFQKSPPTSLSSSGKIPTLSRKFGGKIASNHNNNHVVYYPY